MKNSRRKKHMLATMTIREIRNTFGRFFAVFAIIGIGVGFFSGVRITTPVMINTVNSYYQENQLYDYRAVSTLGWEDSEVRQLADAEGVRYAEGAWQYDVLCETKDGSNGVYKVHSITDEVNYLQIIEGRMPKNNSECLIDSENRLDLSLGDKIFFSDANETDTLDAFAHTSYTVVGFAESSLYINFERGTTSIGNGTVYGFMYLPRQSFSAEYYTDIYVKLDTDEVIYSDAYKEQMDRLRPVWEDLIQAAADKRYDRIYSDAEKELDDARTEFNDKKAEGEQKLSDAEKELADGKKELDDAEAELIDGKKKLDDAAAELADGKIKLDNAAAELVSGKSQLDDAEAELASGKSKLDSNSKTLSSAKSQLDSTKKQLDSGRKELDAAKAKLDKSKKQLDSAKKELDAGEPELKAAEKQLEAYEAQIKESEEELGQAADELTAAKAALDEKEPELLAAAAELEGTKAQLDANYGELSAAKAQIDAADAELDSKQSELEAAFAAELIDEAAYSAGMAEIEAQRGGLEPGRQQYEAGMAAYEAGLAQYEAGKAEYDAGKAAYDEGLAQYEAGKAKYEEGKAAFEQGKAEYEAGKAEYEKSKAAYDKGLAQYKAGLAEYNKGKAAYDKAEAEYKSGLSQYNSGLAQYNSGKAQYDAGVAEYESGLSAYKSAKSQYESGKADYEQGKADYEKGLAEYEDGLAEYNDGLAEYEDGLAEYNDGLAEYEDAKKTFDTEIADAEKKISDAEEDLASFERPDTYSLERTTNIAYACFESDSEIVKQVARVLPLFFILVAVLVCMTTMTRMVDERRGQIGILKGLGYSRRDIMVTFLAYSGIAAALGCVVGYVLGVILFPSVIWYAYEMMYIAIPMRFMTNWKLAISVFLVSMISTLGTTYMSCRSELMEPTASLMRPKAPKAGKRVFLENIPAVWNRMKFMHKVSVRNIFRYKRRFFMMVVGISGCTALLLTGFGIKDSIATFVDTQYDNIQVAEVELVTDEIGGESSAGENDGDTVASENDEDTPVSESNGDTLAGRSDVHLLPDELDKAMTDLSASGFFFQQSSWDLLMTNQVKGVTVIAPDDWSDIDSFFRLMTLQGEKLPAPGINEALISISISRRYGLDVGDEIELRNDEMKTIKATVTGVFENHVYNYVVLSKETIAESTGEYYLNGAYVNFPEGTDIYEAQAALAKCDCVVNATVFADFRERIANMMSSLNYVVLLIIASAAALAFVVLYNLTNINIMERIREIATIKVLGFYRRETSDYVFRENMILTLIGMLTGLGLGVLLHSFVIDQIVVDLVYFRKEIRPLSFVLSIILTFSFTFLVNQIMSFKLDRINMAESLKSVE